MEGIKNLLKDSQLSSKLRTAKSLDEAAQIIVSAGKAKGLNLNLKEVSSWLGKAPRKDPKTLSDEELLAVSGGAIKTTLETKLIDCSKICCFTCRTSEIIW